MVHAGLFVCVTRCEETRCIFTIHSSHYSLHHISSTGRQHTVPGIFVEVMRRMLNLNYSTRLYSPLLTAQIRPALSNSHPSSLSFSSHVYFTALPHPSFSPSFLSLGVLHLLSFIRKGTSTPKDKNSSVRFRNQQGLRSCKVQETERQYSYLVTGDRIKQYEASVLASYAVYEMSDKKQVRTCRQTLHLYGRMDPVRLNVLLRASGCMTNDSMMLFHDSAFTSYVLTSLCCAVVWCGVICYAVMS